MFPKDSWEIDDEFVVEGVTRKLEEFNIHKNQAKMSCLDNEGKVVYRWFNVKDLPPYPSAGEPFLPPHPHPIPPTPALPQSVGEGSEKPITDDLPDDIEVLKQMVRGMKVQLGNQASSLNAMMSEADDALDEVTRKRDEYYAEFVGLAYDLLRTETERDELKRKNEQQSELLRQAAEASIKPVAPMNSIETRLQAIEKQLADIGDWVEGAVQQSMDEADIAAEKRVLELNQPALDYAPLFLVMARAFAMAAGDDLKAVGGHEAQKAS